MGLGEILRRSAGLERRGAEYSIGDPALAEFLGVGTRSTAGQHVTETNALGLTAFYRAVSLISGTLGALPWKTYRTLRDGTRERAASWLDDPGAPVGLTPYAWRELLYVHLCTWGNYYGEIVRNGAGGIMGLRPYHPSLVTVEIDRANGQKRFRVRVDGESREFNPLTMLHIPALSTDGIRGLAPLTVARNSIGAGLAGDEAAARMFENGATIAGLVTTEEEVTEPEAQTIAASLNGKLTGARNAGKIAFVNRQLKFSPWTQTMEDAQFLESRAFQVEEIARFFGLPKVLLAEDGASTWGSGIAELVRGLEKFTFRPWAARVEAALSTLLEGGRFVEIDFAGLLAPSPADELEIMEREINIGLLTLDEARRIKNRPPLTPATEPEEEVVEP
jgi:HK97 family phage portal protein